MQIYTKTLTHTNKNHILNYFGRKSSSALHTSGSSVHDLLIIWDLSGINRT